MSGASQAAAKPEFLRTAAEYRDRLKAELAKVDEFLRRADPRSGPGEYPDFLLTGDDQVLAALGPFAPGSDTIH